MSDKEKLITRRKILGVPWIGQEVKEIGNRDIGECERDDKLNPVATTMYDQILLLNMSIRSGNSLPTGAVEEHPHREDHAHSFYKVTELVSVSRV